MDCNINPCIYVGLFHKCVILSSPAAVIIQHNHFLNIAHFSKVGGEFELSKRSAGLMFLLADLFPPLLNINKVNHLTSLEQNTIIIQRTLSTFTVSMYLSFLAETDQ